MRSASITRGWPRWRSGLLGEAGSAALIPALLTGSGRRAATLGRWHHLEFMASGTCVWPLPAATRRRTWDGDTAFSRASLEHLAYWVWLNRYPRRSIDRQSIVRHVTIRWV